MAEKQNKPLALITGASGGLGRHISVRLADQGYHILAAARNLRGLNETLELIEQAGGSGQVIALDLEKPESAESLKREADRLGGLEILVCNAAVGNFAPMEELSLEDWDHHINLNLRSIFLQVKALLPSLKRNGDARIAFINSVSGKKGFPGAAAYTASKFGLRGFAECLRAEVRSDNIKVISVYPGAFNSPFWDKLDHPYDSGEMMPVDEVASTVVHALTRPGNVVLEEIVLRRTLGDF